jgi:hypothetical protein
VLVARERELRFIELGLADEAALQESPCALEVEFDLRVFAAHARELRARRADVQLSVDSVELRDRLIAMHAAADFDETLRNPTGDAAAVG